jgi:hypothetical protein
MVHKHPGSGRARSDASAGPERVRLQRPPAEFVVTVAPLCLEKMGTPLRLPNRKHSGTYANVGYPLRPKKMDSPYCWKTEIGASLRLQRRVPLPTALSLGSCLDSAVMRQQLLGSSEFHLSVEYRGAGTVPACADHNAPQAAFHLATQGVSHAEWPQDNETAPT